MSELEELERSTLLSDYAAALFANAITWEEFLAIARGLGDQDEPNPWESVAASFDVVNRALDEASATPFDASSANSSALSSSDSAGIRVPAKASSRPSCARS